MFSFLGDCLWPYRLSTGETGSQEVFGPFKTRKKTKGFVKGCKKD